MKKIDFNALLNKGKTFLIEKGERVGLAVCGVIALLLMGMGIMKGMNPEKPASGLPWAEELKKKTEGLSSALAVGASDEVPKVDVDGTVAEPFAWLWRDSRFQSSQLFPLPEQDTNKRKEPKIYTVMDGLYQVDFIRGGVIAYAIDQSKQTAWVVAGQEGVKTVDGGLGTPIIKDMQPRRMIVASMVFPWRHQLVEYLRALKMFDLAELQAQDLLPKPLGLNVVRVEVSNEGKAIPTTKVNLYFYDKEKKAAAAATHIQEFLNAADIDLDNVARLGHHMIPGLATPLPRLANAKYPKVAIGELIKEADAAVVAGGVETPKVGPFREPPPMKAIQGLPLGEKKKFGPMGDGQPQPGQAIPEKSVKWSQLNNKELVAKFRGRFSIFDPSASLPDAGVDGKGFQPKEGGPAKPMFRNPMFDNPMMKKPMFQEKGADSAGEQGPELVDMLARFIDVDLEPGKTYAYFVQVRMANPNFGKKKEVAFLKLAEEEELLSPFTLKPIIVTVDKEYFIYATDQKPDNPLVARGSDAPNSAMAKRSDAAPIQIQKWVGKAGDRPFSIADWVIAERLFIPKGDYMGRNEVNIETPVWNRGNEQFEIGVDAEALKQSDPKRKIGVKMDFSGGPNDPRPLLVDFDGGPRKSVKVGTITVSDDSAYELLVLGPGGKLSVKNSRNDTDNRERIDRYNAWRDKVRALRIDPAAPKKDGGSGDNFREKGS